MDDIVMAFDATKIIDGASYMNVFCSRYCGICRSMFVLDGPNDSRRICPECANRLLKLLYPEVTDNG